MKPKTSAQRRARFLLACLPAGLACSLSAQSPDTAAVIAEMQKQIQALQAEVNRLKAATPPPVTSPSISSVSTPTDAGSGASHDLLGDVVKKAKGLGFGFYGESKYRMPAAGAHAFDAHRFVLTPTYEISDWLVFNSELELEHGGVDESVGRGSRFDGEIELEQFYVDILINDHFNIRSLGIDLVPVGRVNTIHEPTTFYSTERPEIYREIIPSTWMEPSMGIFGKITDAWDYRIMVSTGLEDFTPSGNAGAGVNAANGMRDARPRLRRADEDKLAYTGRIGYTGIKGLDTSASVYHSRGHGAGNQSVAMTLWDLEALYRVPRTGLELRGEVAWWTIENAQNLLANNNASADDNVGNQMYGWHLEAAYHLWPERWRRGRGSKMNFVPFVRFSQIVTQSGLSTGNTLHNGTTNKDFLTFGASYFLNEHFVLKADYRMNLKASRASDASASSQDYFQIGAGVFF